MPWTHLVLELAPSWIQFDPFSTLKARELHRGHSCDSAATAQVRAGAVGSLGDSPAAQRLQRRTGQRTAAADEPDRAPVGPERLTRAAAGRGVGPQRWWRRLAASCRGAAPARLEERPASGGDPGRGRQPGGPPSGRRSQRQNCQHQRRWRHGGHGASGDRRRAAPLTPGYDRRACRGGVADGSTRTGRLARQAARPTR